MIISSAIDYFIVTVMCMGLCEFMGMDNDPSCTWSPCPCSNIFIISFELFTVIAEKRNVKCRNKYR